MLDVTIGAAIIALTGTLIVLSVQQWMESRRQSQRLSEDRKLRLRDDRRLLYRDVLELAFSIVNTFTNAANWAFLDEIGAEKGFQIDDESRQLAKEETGRLTSQVVEKLDIFQARLTEVEILGGKEPFDAALRIHSSIGNLWAAFPTALGKLVAQKEFSKLLDSAAIEIRSFSEAVAKQIRI